MNQKKVDKIIRSFRTSLYANGYIEGVRYARNQLVEFLDSHQALGDILTVQEIIRELEYWKIEDEKVRGLADGIMAPIYGLGESPDICENCFGADLCIVCERASGR